MTEPILCPFMSLLTLNDLFGIHSDPRADFHYQLVIATIKFQPVSARHDSGFNGLSGSVNSVCWGSGYERNTDSDSDFELISGGYKARCCASVALPLSRTPRPFWIRFTRSQPPPTLPT